MKLLALAATTVSLLAAPAWAQAPAPEDATPDALARHVCYSEGMWCAGPKSSRCCRGLQCVDNSCKKKDQGHEGRRGEQKAD